MEALLVDNKIKIPRLAGEYIFFLALALCLCTFLRISLLVIYPVVVVFFVFYFRLRMMPVLLILFGLLCLGWLLSLFNGFYLSYNLVSLYYMVPFLLLLFSVPSGAKFRKYDLVKVFFTLISWITAFSNVIGFWQYFSKPDSDDNFRGIYGSFTISFNGLVILNSIIAFYYFSLYIVDKKRKNLYAFLFFLMSGIMGFFGAGLLVFIVAFVLAFMRFHLVKFIKTLFTSILVLIVAYYSLYFIRPQVLNYNKSNIEKILSFDVENGPRKIIVFYNYLIAYPKHVRDFLFGSGPGTFNSRSAFTVGSPSYITSAEFIKSQRQPFYFKNYAYTLWNETNTSQALFQDGFRNQPFSSVLSFLGEYGLVFTIFFIGGYLLYFRRVRRIGRKQKNNLTFSYRLLFKFVAIFLLLLLLIDNMLEYPEIILLIGVIMKLLHIELLKQEGERKMNVAQSIH